MFNEITLSIVISFKTFMTSVSDVMKQLRHRFFEILLMLAIFSWRKIFVMKILQRKKYFG
jgi:hypothetical protein